MQMEAMKKEGLGKVESDERTYTPQQISISTSLNKVYVSLIPLILGLSNLSNHTYMRVTLPETYPANARENQWLEDVSFPFG